MEKIKLKTIALDGYDEKYKDFVFEISNGNSKSIFVHNIKERIEQSLNKDYFEFECGYVVLYITINIIMLIWKNNSIHKIIKFLQTKKVLTNG